MFGYSNNIKILGGSIWREYKLGRFIVRDEVDWDIPLVD